MTAFASSPEPAIEIKGKVNSPNRTSEKIPAGFCKLGIFIKSSMNRLTTKGRSDLDIRKLEPYLID
jgi:hypothetical protein